MTQRRDAKCTGLHAREAHDMKVAHHPAGHDGREFDDDGRFHGWFVPSERAWEVTAQFGNLCERLRSIRGPVGSDDCGSI